MNPYQATEHALPEAPRQFKWRRAFLWAAVIIVVPNLIGFVQGLTLGLTWQFFGETLQEGAANARLVRLCINVAALAYLYGWYAQGFSKRRWLHVLVLFALTEALDLFIAVAVFQDPLSDLFDIWATGRAVLAAALGLGLAALGSNNSSKPTPLRGAA